MKTIAKRILFLFILVSAVPARADQLQFEGILPPEVDKSAMTAEYFRLYRVLAPRQRPDARPVRIVYLMPKESAVIQYGLPEWGGGGAIGRDLIVIPTAARPFLDQSFSQITRHELAHIVLNRACQTCVIPRWFHEGVAMTLSGELSLEENVIVSKAIFTNSLMSLSSVDSVNAFGRNRADLAYCQSHLSLLFLIDQYGIDVLGEIVAAAKKTGNFWQGVNAVLSITPEEFEQSARAYITSRYRLVFLIADYPGFWVAIVFLFLIASAVAIVRNRKGLGAPAEEAQGSMPATRETNEPDTEQKAGADGVVYDEHGDPPNEDENSDDDVIGNDIELEDDDEDENSSPRT